MIDITTLTKHKYIYRIYEDGADELHCTKHSIIYLNSTVVYFKDARKQEYLNNILVRNISDNFTKYMDEYEWSASWRKIDAYFWDVEGNLQELFQEWKNKRKAAKLIEKENQITNRYLRARKELEDAEAQLELLNKFKEN